GRRGRSTGRSGGEPGAREGFQRPCSMAVVSFRRTVSVWLGARPGTKSRVWLVRGRPKRGRAPPLREVSRMRRLLWPLPALFLACSLQAQPRSELPDPVAYPADRWVDLGEWG